MNYFIYERVSTKNQELARQTFAIEEYCKNNNISIKQENRFSDIITGKTFKRENYQLMKSQLQKNDCLIILDLDRLGRNWELIKQEWKDLSDIGVYIIVVNMPLISVIPQEEKVSLDRKLIQEMMFTLLCYISEKEVEKISTRTKEALAAKRKLGIIGGRKQKEVSKKDIEIITKLYKQNNSILYIHNQTNIGYRVIKRIIGELK